MLFIGQAEKNVMPGKSTEDMKKGRLNNRPFFMIGEAYVSYEGMTCKACFPLGVSSVSKLTA